MVGGTKSGLFNDHVCFLSFFSFLVLVLVEMFNIWVRLPQVMVLAHLRNYDLLIILIIQLMSHLLT